VVVFPVMYQFPNYSSPFGQLISQENRLDVPHPGASVYLRDVHRHALWLDATFEDGHFPQRGTGQSRGTAGGVPVCAWRQEEPSNLVLTG